MIDRSENQYNAQIIVIFIILYLLLINIIIICINMISNAIDLGYLRDPSWNTDQGV